MTVCAGAYQEEMDEATSGAEKCVTMFAGAFQEERREAASGGGDREPGGCAASLGPAKTGPRSTH